MFARSAGSSSAARLVSRRGAPKAGSSDLRRSALAASYHIATPSSSSSSIVPAPRTSSRALGKQARRTFAIDAQQQATSLPHDADSSDVVIVGGGVVGLALACALAASPSFRASGAGITLIEASPLQRLRTWSTDKQSEGSIGDWENRAIYLTEENRAWIDGLHVDGLLLRNRLGDVHSMHVTDGLTGAALDFDVPNAETSHLGTMVEISNLQQAMLRRLEQLTVEGGVPIRILDGTKVERIEALEPGQTASPTPGYSDAWPLVHLSDGQKPIKARLLVGADGHNSPVRKYAGISAHGWPYERLGVVGTIKVRDEQQQPQPRTAAAPRIAFQRFLPTGTIAWLPLAHDAASLVWTLPPDVGKAIVGLQKRHEARNDGSSSPVAHLITAGFRLPWSALESIFARLVSEAQAGTHDDGWFAQVMTASMEGEPIDDTLPAPAADLFEKSVAAFPLKLSHAESYLGSSLRQTTIAEAGAGALLPSAVLQSVINGVSSFATKGLGSSSGSEDARGAAHGRTVLIGDAAHTIHPLAGQGLNLGLADARSLADALVRAVEEGGDLGSHLSLQAYPRQRYLANQVMLSAVDHLHWLFVTPKPPGTTANASTSVAGDVLSRAVVWARSTGFEVLNELDVVKRAIVGAAGSARRRS